MPWVYVCTNTDDCYLTGKCQKNGRFHRIPNIETKQWMRLPRIVMIFPCMPTSHLPTNRLWASRRTVGFTLMGAGIEDKQSLQISRTFSVSKSGHKLGENCWGSVMFEWQVNNITNRTKCIIMHSCSTKLPVATPVLAPSFLTGDRGYVRIWASRL